MRLFFGRADAYFRKTAHIAQKRTKHFEKIFKLNRALTHEGVVRYCGTIILASPTDES